MTTQSDIQAVVYRGNCRFAVEGRARNPPRPDEVSIRPVYCGICGTDLHVYHGHLDERVRIGRIIGHEMSGCVVGTGRTVEEIGVGDRVVVRPLAHCGTCPTCAAGHRHICQNLKFLGLDLDGAMQEIWNVPSFMVHRIPDGLPYKHASLIEPFAVACHSVRLAELTEGECAFVIGGGPIGLLVAVAARDAGASVLISEVNPHRLEIARLMGFEAVNPVEENLEALVLSRTGGCGAEVVFEVSGSQAGIDAMTAVAASRARLVVVAVHARKPKMDLYQLFWRELKVIGTRVYEAEDYERAIRFVAAGQLDADTIVTDIYPLGEIQAAFDSLDANPSAMKTLIQVSAEI